MNADQPLSIAFFITAHGFGHASRAAAVMTALHDQHPGVHFEIFTTVPDWFFRDSLRVPYTLHEVQTDVGLVQRSAMQEDLPATLRKLDAFIPFDPVLVSGLAQEVRQLGCALVVCDIAPLGIAVAHSAALPSVLVENFTWDWIYAGYLRQEPDFQKYIDTFAQLFHSASFHIQTEPLCAPDSSASLRALPASRPARTRRADTRRRLEIPESAKAVLVTMGGIPENYQDLDRFSRFNDIYFIIPAGSTKNEFKQNFRLMPHHSDFYHPDLMFACDAAIGKSGYSTTAEAYYAGVPFAFISRADFREAAPLAKFILSEMNGLEIQAEAYQDGTWIERVPDLLAMPHIQRTEPNGADQIAQFILTLL
jgi:hypothetical protein